ncbi:hypothetical protein TBS_32510 [Thermobispora bispora]
MRPGAPAAAMTHAPDHACVRAATVRVPHPTLCTVSPPTENPKVSLDGKDPATQARSGRMGRPEITRAGQRPNDRPMISRWISLVPP